MSKYKAIKTVIDGIRFDSLAESKYYVYLKSCKDIKIISLQPKVYLTDSKILYRPDFLIEKNGELIYVDVKGFQTPVFAIKARLWVNYGAGRLDLIKNGKLIKTIVTKT